MANKLLPRLAVPHQDTANPAPIEPEAGAWTCSGGSPHRRGEPELLTRVAAIVMLLYAQPLTRILSLTLDNVVQRERRGQVAIRLGDPPAPVPEPFASLLLRHMGQRLNTRHRHQRRRPLAVPRQAPQGSL